jgi:RNA polymerase sigma-70 factor (ECF subfamily)
MPTSEEFTDEDIVRQVQAGNRELFGELVRRYEPRMARYAHKFLFQGDEVKDVVQEVFIKAYINIQSVDATRKFSSWLYRVAHNEFINAGKKRKRLPFFTFDLDALVPHLTARETAEGPLVAREMKEMLEGSLGELSLKYKEPLILYYLEELTYQEIADILRIPISTVGVRLARGRAALAALVTKKYGGEH